MLASSLLEVVAALAVNAVLLATCVTTVVTVDMAREGTWREYARLASRRHVEHLVDRAFDAAGTGPHRPAPIAVARRDELVLQADHDGDGVIDPRSSERTALLIRPDGEGRLRLLHRLGRQSMSVAGPLDPNAEFRYLAADGAPASSIDAIRLVRVPVGDGGLWAALPRPP